MGERTGLESALAATEQAVAETLVAAAALSRGLKRARTAAAVGQVKDLRRALDEAAAAAARVTQQAAAARDGYDIDEEEWLTSGGYRKELLAAAADAGLDIVEEDDRLLCYPSLVRVLPGEVALDIDRQREKRLRPSVVVTRLAQAQRAGPRFRPEPLLRSLAAGYDLVLALQGKPAGAVVRLVDIYAVMTLLPGQTREYSKHEFARDLYLLDQTGAATVPGTRRRLHWAASTGTKQAGVLTTVARSGSPQRYWGVAFREDGDG